MSLRDKVAIVTGAASGIGEAIARRFAAESARVVLADIDADRGQRIERDLRAHGGEAIFVQTDVALDDRIRNMVEAAVRAYGRLDVLVSNAGINMMKTAETATLAEWERCLNVDLRGVWLGAKYAIPEMRRVGGGSIINIASMHAFRTMKSCHPYAAAKGGVVSMTKSLAVDYGRDHIRANAICPGTIQTPLLESHLQEFDDADEARRRFLRAYPLGRFGTPDEVACLALFLASDESAFITGIAIPIDGGRDALSASGV